MKKAIVIILALGMGMLLLAYYYAYLYVRFYQSDMKQLEKLIDKNSSLNSRIYHLQKNDENKQEYNHIELSEYDYISLHNCIQQSFLNEKELPYNCKEGVINILISENGEIDFIKSVMGHFIDYYWFEFDHFYLEDLFNAENMYYDDNLLKERLILHFLNKYRNPQKLQKAFNKYKNYFYNKIPKSLYDKVLMKKVTALLNAYKEIESKEDKEAYFKEIYFKAESQRSHLEYWETTFWKRRELEKNDKVIFSILTEIQAHYK